MKIEKVKIGLVKNNPNNPRIIKDDKFKNLVESIKSFPKMLEIRPIVVNKDMIVLGGNMRLKASISAGLKEVPIIRAENLTEDEEREFIIKDNVSGGEWDWSMLANEWEQDELEKWGLDIPDFASDEILEAEEDDFEVPADGIETDIVLGDLFEIGEHRLLCGDSTDSDAVTKLMDGQKADMVFTDPPYGVSYQSNFRTKTEKFDKNDEKICEILCKMICPQLKQSMEYLSSHFAQHLQHCWYKFVAIPNYQICHCGYNQSKQMP
jgi:hypothetical protein